MRLVNQLSGSKRFIYFSSKILMAFVVNRHICSITTHTLTLSVHLSDQGDEQNILVSWLNEDREGTNHIQTHSHSS